jgi:hypothetical protein
MDDLVVTSCILHNGLEISICGGVHGAVWTLLPFLCILCANLSTTLKKMRGPSPRKDRKHLPGAPHRHRHTALPY